MWVILTRTKLTAMTLFTMWFTGPQADSVIYYLVKNPQVIFGRIPKMYDYDRL